MTIMLRDFALSDAPRLHELIRGDHDIYNFTLSIPADYSLVSATEWIEAVLALTKEYFRQFAVVFNGEIIGAIGLERSPRHPTRGSVGYWIGRDYRKSGHATAALKLILAHGFNVMELNRIEGRHFAGNDGSGKVMVSAGMHFEATLHESVCKDGRHLDESQYYLLRAEYITHNPPWDI